MSESNSRTAPAGTRDSVRTKPSVRKEIREFCRKEGIPFDRLQFVVGSRGPVEKKAS